MKRMELVAAAAAIAALLAGCSSQSGATDESVSRLFEDHYPEFMASAKAHHAGCDLSLAAKGSAGTKRDSLSSSVDVDANGSYRIVHDDGGELLRVGLHTWSRPRDGKWTALEAGAQPDLARDAAVAEWRDLLEPVKEHMKLKRTGSGKLGSRPTEIFDVTFDNNATGDAPKVEKGAGKFEVDEETGFPVKVDLSLTWSAKGNDGARVTWTLEKLGCAVTQLGAVEVLAAPEGAEAGGVSSAATPAPTATATAKAKTEKHDARPAATRPGKKPK